AVCAHDDRARAAAELEAHPIDDGAAARDKAHFAERERQDGARRAHSAHPYRRCAASLRPSAAALMSSTSVIRITPTESASGRSPLEVSSAMVVVITRVTPAMLPPTIMTAPTSAEARPRPASTAVSSEKRMSQTRVSAARNPTAPSE